MSAEPYEEKEEGTEQIAEINNEEQQKEFIDKLIELTKGENKDLEKANTLSEILRKKHDDSPKNIYQIFKKVDELTVAAKTTEDEGRLRDLNSLKAHLLNDYAYYMDICFEGQEKADREQLKTMRYTFRYIPRWVRANPMKALVYTILFLVAGLPLMIHFAPIIFAGMGITLAAGAGVFSIAGMFAAIVGMTKATIAVIATLAIGLAPLLLGKIGFAAKDKIDSSVNDHDNLTNDPEPVELGGIRQKGDQSVLSPENQSESLSERERLVDTDKSFYRNEPRGMNFFKGSTTSEYKEPTPEVLAQSDRCFSK